MGELATYQCDKCNYSAQISGGPDMGMMVKTNTYVCQKCKEIVDVITFNVDSEENNVGKCPSCHSTEQLEVWDNRKCPCPKCNGKMKISPNGLSILWD